MAQEMARKVYQIKWTLKPVPCSTAVQTDINNSIQPTYLNEKFEEPTEIEGRTFKL